MKSLLRTLLLFSALGGCVLALWPAGQNLYSRRSQAALHREFAAKKKTKTVKAHGKPKPLAASRKVQARPNLAQLASAAPAVLPATRLICPEAGVDAVVVQGVRNEDLRRGPGWMPGSALPGQPGNCVIAGHRNVYGSPFAKLDMLLPGSEILLETPDDSYRYLVVSVFGAADNDPSVLKPPTDGSARLTLYTCTTPKTTYRLVVSAVKTD